MERAMDMTLNPSAFDIAVRLALTIAAAALIGLNREQGGHSAGLRTTVLVALAASVAMIQVNFLIGLEGKTPGSFIQLDVMRLPLGVLTGMGFIGGGAILKRGAMVSGLTTAATLWSVTIIGLCFGGGQILLGITATALIYLTLAAVHVLDLKIARQKRSHVVLVTDGSGPSITEIAGIFERGGWQPRFLRQTKAADPRHHLTKFEVRWKEREAPVPPPGLIELIQQNFNCQSFEILDDGGH